MPNHKQVVLAILIGGVLGLGVIGVSLFQQLSCEGQFVNVNFAPSAEQEIQGERVIGQSFVAPRDRLNRIDLLLQSYQRLNTHEVTLRLFEISAGSETPFAGTELFQTSFNAATVSNEAWRRFDLPEIADSAGKTFLVRLESPASEPGNAITIGGIDKDAYPAGSAYLGPVAVPGDLAFRACFQMSAGEKLQTLGGQITQNRPGVWSYPVFYLFTFVVYGGLLGGLFWLLAKLALR